MENNDASICPLCRQEKVKIFAVGECSHPVCYLCSTKMRILCEQTYCAICRQELPRVYFVSKISDTEPTIDQSRFTPIDETGDCGIYYPIKSEWIRRETEKLLRNICPFCYYEYETFEILRDHVRRTHRYFYCDLCVENLNLFLYERKCYTRHDLVQHIRCGDRDDTSFKGHLICQFCDDHFVDDDQLYKHMRKEHYYCHLCTNDNVYYSDFDLLRGHYRKNHYLCELDQCKDVQFTNVFSSDFEFRAHQAAQHGKTRAQAKQLGTIPVEFQSRNVHDRRQPHDPAHRGTFKSGKFNTEETNKLAENERDAGQQEPAVAVTVPSIDEFPILTERSSTPQNVPQQRGAWSNDVRGIHSSDDFPALTSATNVPITNAGQPKGIWREQQQQQAVAASNTQSTTSKKASQATKSVTSEIASVNVNEDFPALKSASNTKIPPPVSMFSAWSTAKKTAKNANANAKANQPQTRMNANRLAYDDEDEEYIRRPMASLMTSTTSMASSNITMISSSDVSGAQVNEKQNKKKNQSLPNAQDFPALPSTNTPSNSTASGVWTAAGTNKSEKSSTTQQKKKSSAASKKKFMEEVQALPPALSSNEDFPAFGLSELGRRLITEENQPTVVTTQVKEEKPLPSLPSSATTKQEKKEEKKSTVPSNKKQVQKATKTNDSVAQELPSRKDEIPVKPITNQASSIQNEPIPQAAPPPPPSSTQPPPGFAAPLTVSPPPGFNPMPSSQPVPLSYIYSSTYPKQKDEFRAKLFTLFDGDINLVLQYDQFCEAFSQNKITSKDFIEFTTRLFNDKLDQYLLELIMIIPNIEQQNELYSIWENDLHPSTTQNANNWTKKNHMENNVHKCRICQQIMFETDTIEHNLYHPEFNTQFPSLSTAAIPIGRSNGKKNK
jgi:hypothetical protein